MIDVVSKSGTIQESEGVTLHYSIDGPSDAPWLIFSNSLATDMRMWDAQLFHFAQTHRMLRYDTRGHGGSGLPSRQYGFADLAKDVVALMDEMGVDQADFIGISMGGMTGLATAIHYPDRIGRLICCDGRADAPAPYKAIWDANVEKVRKNGMDSIVGPTMERWFTEAFRNDDHNERTLHQVADMIRSTPAQGYELAARCLQSLDLLPQLGQITCPTLYVVGEHDLAAPVAVMQDMTERTPGAALSVIEGAAHLSNIEQPHAFNETVSEFLSTPR